ncbi:MAG: hydrogenase formation protein HypD [Nitrospirota bacterium]|jgi:hydrogenase expression/formation protein HypD
MKDDIAKLAEAIRVLAGRIGRPLKLMEVCGTHTVAIFRHGIRGLLPGGITLLSGPGCPVCVTSISDVDTAVALAKTPGVALVTFGDMMRVPGGRTSLYGARAEGADVRVVYSPLDALAMARKERDRRVVFFATGFETTSPLVAATVKTARKEGLGNFFVYPAHKLVPPALRALLDAPEVKVDGFILPGHVSTIIGLRAYGFLAGEYGVPSVVTGFSARDILEGILMLLEQIVSGRPAVGNQYEGVVREEGNPAAVAAIEEVFEPSGAYWRGIGPIPKSGLSLRAELSALDIRNVIPIDVPEHPEPRACSCGEVLRGLKLPTDCPLFGRACTPESPVGACMVSTEGSCAAYYRYGGGAAGG